MGQVGLRDGDKMTTLVRAMMHGPISIITCQPCIIVGYPDCFLNFLMTQQQSAHALLIRVATPFIQVSRIFQDNTKWGNKVMSHYD